MRRCAAVVLAAFVLSAAGLAPRSLRAQDEPEARIASLDERLARDPARTDWLLERAQLARLRGDFGAALADLDAIAELAPLLPELCLERALVLELLGFPREAEWDLTGFLAAHPHAVEALAARGRVRELLGRNADARRDYEQAAALDPSVERYLARCGFEERDGDLGQAALCLSEGLGELHEARALRRALVRVETARRDYQRALALTDTLIGSAALQAEAYLDRADVYEQAGKPEHAARDRARALGLSERDRDRYPAELRRELRNRALAKLEHADEDAEDRARTGEDEADEESEDLAALRALRNRPGR